jgi:hypothetical protein
VFTDQRTLEDMDSLERRGPIRLQSLLPLSGIRYAACSMSYRHTFAISGAIAALASVSPVDVATAQDGPFRIELTPYAAYRVGGQFEEQDGDGEFELEDSAAHGLILNIRATANTQWELLYSSQDTEIGTQSLFAGDPVLDVDVEYFHFGGTYLFEGEAVRPFFAMTAGLSRFDPQGPNLSAESDFSASIGGGLQLRATERLGIRLEARAFTTFVDSDSDIFCLSAGGAAACAVRVEGTTLTQLEARAGMVFRF